MSSAIVPFVPADIEQAVSLADRLSKSSLLPEALRGKPSDVLVMIITGVELGLSPMQSIRGLHVIKGKAVMSADLQVALVKKHSDCVYFRLVESTGTKAMYETERKGEQKTCMSFTIDQAKNAGLLGNDNWRKYPDAMLRARCSSALARAVYPDLTMGVYEQDEAEAFGAPHAPAPSPAVVERELNPPPPLAMQQVVPVASGKRTAEVKAQLAARQSRIVVETNDGEVEAKPAPVTSSGEPPASVKRPTPPQAKPQRKMPLIQVEGPPEPPPLTDEDFR